MRPTEVTALAGENIDRSALIEELHRRYGDGGFAIMRLVAMTGNFISSRKADDVKAFFENNPTPSATRTIKQSIERINLNAAWLDRYDNDLQRWFSKYPNKA